MGKPPSTQLSSDGDSEPAPQERAMPRALGARREINAAVAERYRVAGRAEKGRILDELCKVTDLHRKHAVRALANRRAAAPKDAPNNI